MIKYKRRDLPPAVVDEMLVGTRRFSRRDGHAKGRSARVAVFGGRRW